MLEDRIARAINRCGHVRTARRPGSSNVVRGNWISTPGRAPGAFSVSKNQQIDGDNTNIAILEQFTISSYTSLGGFLLISAWKTCSHYAGPNAGMKHTNYV